MSCHVLIVEDSLPSASIYSNILSDEGYECEITDLLTKAIDRLRDEIKPKIDITLLDLTLPNGSGVDLVRKFNSRFPQIPLVVITGMDIKVGDVIEMGAQSVLLKGDFRDKDLVRAVKEAIPRHQVRGQFLPLEKELKYLKEHIAKTVEKLADPTKSSLTDGK